MKGLWLGCAIVVIPIMQSVSADAADLGPQFEPILYPYEPFTWTGFYIGPNLGVAWPGGNITDTVSGTNLGGIGGAAFVGGGQLGYNYQINPNIVLGVEWLIDGVAGNNNSNIVVIPTISDVFQASFRSDWFTTLTGRVGFTGTGQGWDRALFYIKGGAAWVQNQATVADLSTGLSVGATRIDSGWVAGAGLEYAFPESNWTIRLEYDYIGLDNSTVGTMTVDPYNKQKPSKPPTTVTPVIPPMVRPTPPSTFVSETFNAGNQSAQVVMLGINYKFGYAPPPAIVTKY
jgi:outer membrane immunogenic protein